MKNNKDQYTTRPWLITHIGPKFMTIKAIDGDGLKEDELVNVVPKYDIIPELHAKSEMNSNPIYSNLDNTEITPPPVTPVPIPTVIIAPKFFNGNGSDNSTSEIPNEVSQLSNTQIETPVTDTPVIEYKEPKQVDIANDNNNNNNDNNNDYIDFSNIIIKKQDV